MTSPEAYFPALLNLQTIPWSPDKCTTTKNESNNLVNCALECWAFAAWANSWRINKPEERCLRWSAKLAMWQTDLRYQWHLDCQQRQHLYCIETRRKNTILTHSFSGTSQGVWVGESIYAEEDYVDIKEAQSRWKRNRKRRMSKLYFLSRHSFYFIYLFINLLAIIK